MPPDQAEPPPFLKTWERLYLAVLIYLAALIIVLELLTGAFTY